MINHLTTSGERHYAEAFIKARLELYVSRDIIERIWAAGIRAAIEDKLIQEATG